MRIGILVDILDEHSGARAVPMLSRALAAASPKDDFVILTAQNRLRASIKDSLADNLKVIVFAKSLFFSLDLWKKIREENIKIVSAHCSLRLLLTARLSGVRIVRTDYGSQFPSLNNSFYSWCPSLINSIINYIGDVWVYFRDYLKFIFSHRSIGISRDNALKAKKLYGQKIDFVYLGADDFDAYKGDSFGKGVSFSSLRILSVSRFVPYKGFHVLIEAFKNISAKHANLELVLIGGQAGGGYWDFLKKSSAGCNNIKILLNPDDQVLAGYFGSSHIYASGTRWEAFGLPFLEASLFGLPTLGFSFFGSAAEVIKDDETGLLAEDFSDFQNKLERLIVDETLRRRLGQAGREFASTFTWQKTARSYLEIFRNLSVSVRG